MTKNNKPQKHDAGNAKPVFSRGVIALGNGRGRVSLGAWLALALVVVFGLFAQSVSAQVPETIFLFDSVPITEYAAGATFAEATGITAAINPGNDLVTGFTIGFEVFSPNSNWDCIISPVGYDSETIPNVGDWFDPSPIELVNSPVNPVNPEDGLIGGAIFNFDDQITLVQSIVTPVIVFNVQAVATGPALPAEGVSCNLRYAEKHQEPEVELLLVEHHPRHQQQ